MFLVTGEPIDSCLNVKNLSPKKWLTLLVYNMYPDKSRRINIWPTGGCGLHSCSGCLSRLDCWSFSSLSAHWELRLLNLLQSAQVSDRKQLLGNDAHILCIHSMYSRVHQFFVCVNFKRMNTGYASLGF